LNIKGFTSREDFISDFTDNPKQDYCFGFEFSKIRPGVKEVNITYMFPYDASLNTYEPLYELSTG
jgi:hypothetical protein